jgi:DNA polymerase (family 10)
VVPTGAAGDAPEVALLLTNARLAGFLREIADLLEIRGDSSFKVSAYRRAADSVARCPVEVATAYRAGQPPMLTGVGSGLSERIDELATTGRSSLLEALRQELPPTLPRLLDVPGVGPRTAGEVWRALGIATLEDLESAARAGRLRQLRGLSSKSEARILAGLADLRARPPRRLHIGEAHALADRVVELLEGLPGVLSATPAGSLRRMSETVGDLDVLLETDRPIEVLSAAAALPVVEGAAVAGIRPGGDRLTLQLLDGPRLDLMTMPPGAVGSYLVHLTGSAEHNVRLRSLARSLGWSLSEHGLTRLPVAGGPGEGSRPADEETRTFATEAEVYAALGLELVPPELREDGGEIEAAASRMLPRLVEPADLRGDCHSHSDWSDGREPLDVMVESARLAGRAYHVLSDHSQSLTIAGGLSPAQVERQRRVIAELNERFVRESARGETPEGADPAFRLLHGTELEITLDGRLDYDDDVLARFDVVIASLHVGRRQPRAQLMGRYEAAMRSPHVDIISHPSGRRIGSRPDLDLDWEAFYRLAAETGTLLEINGSPPRMDLAAERVRVARDAGCRFVIGSDAHHRSEWQHLLWGTAVARRGWLEAHHVANTRDLDGFLAIVRGKADRL